MKLFVRCAAFCLPLIVVAVLAGCSKKKEIAEPAPPPPPPTTAETTPPPAPPPTTTEPEQPNKTVQDQLADVFFDYDSAELSSSAQSTLDADGKVLNDNGGSSITIEGHCDERGTVEYNLALGDRRAASAKDYLVRFGIPATRISTVSYGEERPFATGSDEAAFAQNRRAHFVVR
jgi:peptidoglycan-associated lipoprotein